MRKGLRRYQVHAMHAWFNFQLVKPRFVMSDSVLSDSGCFRDGPWPMCRWGCRLAMNFLSLVLETPPRPKSPHSCPPFLSFFSVESESHVVLFGPGSSWFPFHAPHSVRTPTPISSRSGKRPYWRQNKPLGYRKVHYGLAIIFQRESK